MAACLPRVLLQETAHSCMGAAGDQDHQPAARDTQWHQFSAAYLPLSAEVVLHTRVVCQMQCMAAYVLTMDQHMYYSLVQL
jgi:hypothetical protein